MCVRYHVTVPGILNAKDTMASIGCVKEGKCSIHSRIFVITREMSTVNQLKVSLNDLDYVQIMPAHFENGEKCDGSKICARVHTIPVLTVKNQLQDFGARKMYLHSKNRPVSLKKLQKMFCLHHFQVCTRCCLESVPLIRVPFSKSTVCKICL